MVKKMEYKSLWLKDLDTSDYNELNKNLEVDVLIIGGGITGLTTLYNLRESHLKVALVEANLIGSGVSGYTTGKINYLQGLVYQKITQKYSLEMAKLYLESQKTAIKFITDTIKNEKIKCDLQVVDSYVYTNLEEDIPKIKYEKEILTKLGINVQEITENILDNENKYAIKVEDTYVFHPYKYLQSLKKICLKYHQNIYEKTKILDFKLINNHYICYTDNYRIIAKKIVLACHYPFFLFPYFMPIKTKIEKSYIGAVEDTFKNATLITPENPTTSVRYQKGKEEYLIYLTNSSNIDTNLDENANYQDLLTKLKKKHKVPKYLWKNDDILTVDNIPYIGKIEKGNNNLLIGTGYNTWGMTNGTLAGLILSDIVLENKNKFIKLCNPLRVNVIFYLKSYLVNMYSSLGGYLKSKVNKNKEFYPNNVKYTKINNVNVAIYKEGNKTYKVYNKCPHMGCSLIFNPKEKTWDCPCHASRFSLSGKCLKGPSNIDITYKE